MRSNSVHYHDPHTGVAREAFPTRFRRAVGRAVACAVVLGAAWLAIAVIRGGEPAVRVLRSRDSPYNIVREYDILARWDSVERFPDIPKVVHQVWIGPLDRAMCKWMDTFREDFMRANPGWHYKLWNRELFEAVHGPMVLGRQYDMEPAVQAKADILRYEIIWREGGVYVDADSVWMGRPLDPVLEQARATGMFTVGHEPPGVQDDLYMNGVFGACACHPAMEHVIRNIQVRYAELALVEQMVFYKRVGPFFFSAALHGFNVTHFPMHLFAPGSWFFDKSDGGLDATVERRMAAARQEHPDAIMFQVGFNTHASPSTAATSCAAWAASVEPQLEAMARAVPPPPQLQCGAMDYRDATAAQRQFSPGSRSARLRH